MSWARHLRKVHVEWHPFSAPATAQAWFGVATAKKVLVHSPKLKVSKALFETSATAGEPPAPQTVLTFVDGSKQSLDLSAMLVRQHTVPLERPAGGAARRTARSRQRAASPCVPRVMRPVPSTPRGPPRPAPRPDLRRARGDRPHQRAARDGGHQDRQAVEVSTRLVGGARPSIESST